MSVKKENNLYDRNEILIFDLIFITRFVVWVSVGVVVFLIWSFGFLEFNPLPFVFLIPAYLIINAILWRLSRRIVFFLPFVFFQFLLAIVMTTLIVHYSGGLESSFDLLYVIPFVEAILVSIPISLLFGAVTVAVYSLFILSEHFGWMVRAVPISNVKFQDDLMINIAMFVLVGASTAFQNFYFNGQIKKINQRAMKEKDDFLFRTVHDLRSPSNTVRLILEKYAKSDFLKRYPELKEDISIIQELDARMLQLVNDLLLVGKGEEAGTLVKKEKVDISLIIQQVLNECSAIAAVKNIKFRYDPPADLPFVAADTGLVSEVVLNLVDNAIKYNKPGGDVIISHAVMNGFLETAIQDTGIGIAPENTDNLFKPYFRGEQSGKIRGTGLGLYIVKRLVEKMNGSVGISSLVGQGTKITFSLPMVTEKG